MATTDLSGSDRSGRTPTAAASDDPVVEEDAPVVLDGPGARDVAGRLLVGHVLAERYRLEAPIGTGASGRVFAATDLRLDRRVAVKILHDALAGDAGFQRRLRAEAHLAASLHHPNIVTVHDWGEDTTPDGPLHGAVFMVLELLEGGSLRSMLDAGHHLSVAQAAHLAADVAGALDYAHRRGIVHRDVKPGNLLFDEHGVVRIADFGLARALAEASWTEPTGAVLATARYASPEQAMGVQLDARSDLYSLAIVICEAVTGTIPFASDTTIGLLSARTQAPIVAPPELGPLVAVIERAGRIDPGERYPDAGTMRAALLDAAESLPKPGPLTLVGNADVRDPHPTSAVALDAPAPATPGTNDAVRRDDDAVLTVRVPKPRLPRRAKGDAARRASLRGRRLVPVAVALALVVALSAGVLAVGRITGVVGGSAASASVPGLVGRPLAEAKAMAERAGFDVVTERAEERSTDPVGLVLGQAPEPGAFASDGATIRLTLAAGPPQVRVPDLVGRKAAAAVDALAALGVVPSKQRVFDEKVPEGTVMRLQPAVGQQADLDGTVTLIVSRGPEPRIVPSFAGGDWNTAKAGLEELGLQPAYQEDFSDSVAPGYVISTYPATGEAVKRGGTVTVSISKGPELVSVPDVRGMLLDNAAATLEGAGFEVGNVRGYRRGAQVRYQNPNPGTLARRGTEINLLY